MLAGANAQIIKSGNITANETWTSNNIYLLNGWVYVKAGVTLTIQPGTIIKGDFVSKGSLIIERDAKIIADGTADQPIVFTSQKAPGQRSYGDWGGLIICGKASVNLPANVSAGTQAGEGVIEGGVGSLYGGGTNPDDNDSSGVLRYVRIEYPGVAFQPNSEINGLTMGGVGRKTVIDYVQVSYSGDDSYEWFGGTVNCKHLISYRGWDDDFDTDNGFKGNIQYGLVVRDPNVADQSGSNGFESDNDATGSGNTPITQPVFSNITLVGPYAFNSNINSNYKRALHLRRNCRTSVYNSVFIGYPTGLLIESTTTQTNAINNDLQFRNSVLCQMNDTLAATTAANPNNSNGAFFIGDANLLNGWFGTSGFSNANFASISALMFNSVNLSSPDFLVQTGSPLLSGASFTNPNLSNSFFNQVAFRGAFDSSNDWTSCWTEYDCQNQAYNAAINNAFSVTAVATGSTTFCQGGSVTLDAGAYPNATYLWSNGATTQSTTVTTSGTYYCTVTKSNGCFDVSNSITVTVNPLPAAPVISTSGPTSICNGDNVTLTSSYSSSNTWSTGATTQGITVNATGNYSVTYTDGNGCTNSDTVTVTVNANPQPPIISASGPTSFCTGDSVMLSSNQSTGILWSTNATTQNIYVNASGNYTVTYTDANGCSATSNPISVSVSSSPAPTVSVSGSTALCPGETAVLTASLSDSYQWYLNGNPMTGETNQTLSVTGPGAYTVFVTNSNACNGSGMSSQIVITQNTAPAASFTYSWNGTIVVFSNTSNGGTIYSWDFGDQSGSTAQNPQHVYTSDNNYTVTLIVTNADGCTDTATATVQFFVGVDEQTLVNGITLYPNPANDQINIALNLNGNSDVNVFAYDMSGRVLINENQSLSAGNTTLSYVTENWNNGVYFVRLTAGNSVHTLKVVINK
ncbi:MAG: hypothetical protein Fur0041_12590 [Bacteroidia bacterium]